MRLFVTGGTGFVGSHTVEALVRAGHDVRLLVRDPEKAQRVFAVRGLKVPENVVGDATDPAAVVRGMEACDAVFHAAALVALDAGSAERVEHNNVRATEVVVGEARRRGLAPIVHVSSLAALFDPARGPMGPDSAPRRSADSAYGRSKARCDRWVRELQDQGVPVAATYPSGVLGPDAPSLGQMHRSLPLQLRSALVTATGCNFVDVRDLARVHAALFERPPAPGRWIVGGPYLSWAEVAGLLRELTGRRIPRVVVPGALLRGLGRLGDVAQRVAEFEFPLTREAMDFATRWPGADSEATVRALDVAFRDARETFADTLRWMAAEGHVPAGRVGRLAEDLRRGGRPSPP
jgi:dihydroflavonol-4-reductase